MQVSDLELRPLTGLRPEAGLESSKGTAPNRRLEELLPASGISLAPPATEDRLEISPLAHAILQASQHLETLQEERIASLRLQYLRGGLEVEDRVSARSIVDALLAESAPGAEAREPAMHRQGPAADRILKRIFAAQSQQTAQKSSRAADENIEGW